MRTATDLGTARSAAPPDCDSEPIHIPGSIQPHGTLLILDGATFRVLRAASNAADLTGRPGEDVAGLVLEDLVPPGPAAMIRAGLDDSSLERNPRSLGVADLPTGRWRVLAHRIDGRAIVELEPAVDDTLCAAGGPDPLLRAFLARLPGVDSTERLAEITAEEVRRRTGFDRVLVYRFDADGHGTVVAEDRNDALPSYLGLRFPASDIPRQARALYLAQKSRIIVDAHYDPVPILPAADPPDDLSYAALRSVSRVHRLYMRNMGTASSMSISITRGGELWGLVSCHNRSPKFCPFEIRSACEILSGMLSAYMEVREHNEEFAARMRLKSIEARLLGSMAEEEFFLDGLRNNLRSLLEFGGAEGAAIVVADKVRLVGRAPSEEWVHKIVERLGEDDVGDVFLTDSLASRWPEAEAIRDVASGLMAVAVSRLHHSYLLWFRPEAQRTVRWAGDPTRPHVEEDGPLRPRASFETWKEVVRLRSEPWSEASLHAAAEFRAAIVNIVLRKAEELAELSDELQRSNKELEAFSYSVSHDLRAPLRHVTGYAEMLREELGDRATATSSRYIDTIVDSARYAGTLVDNLLSFAQVGRAKIVPTSVDLNRLAEEIRRDVANESEGRDVVWTIRDLPVVKGDLMMLRLALRNLFSNAVKYTRGREPARIEVGASTEAGRHVLFVRDNGVGFDMAYVDKLWGIFQRLHRWEDFEGTGIGLANVRRIAERHGGRTWAEGEVDRGATFFLAIPTEAQ